MMACPRDGNHFFEAGEDDVVEEASDFSRWLTQANRRADLRAVAAVAGRKLHDDNVALAEHATRWPGIAEDQRGISHRRRTDDREVDVSAAFENGAGCGGFELVFGHARFAACGQSLHRGFTQFSRLTDALKLFVAFLVDQLMHEAR